MHLDAEILFIHIPRTSGTSFRRALLRGKDPNRALRWPACLPHLGKHLTAAQARQAFKESSMTPPDAWDRLEKVTIVRNPWDRMVSLYHLWRRPIDNSEKMTVENAKWGPKIDKAIAQLHSSEVHSLKDKKEKIEFLRKAFNLNFKDWLNFTFEHDWQGCPYLPRPMTKIPQAVWAEGCNTILRFEDRQGINDWLHRRSYYNPIKENETEREDWLRYYDSDTYDLVSDIFEADRKVFGY